MEIIRQLEEDILALPVEERITRMKDISYFIQCASQMVKAAGEKPDSIDKLKIDMKGLITLAKEPIEPDTTTT